MERTDWLEAGFAAVAARFLMLTAIRHHRFGSSIWERTPCGAFMPNWRRSRPPRCAAAWPAGDGLQLKRARVADRERKLDDNRCPLTRRAGYHHGPPECLDPVSQPYDP
jgi:hypothetical protein